MLAVKACINRSRLSAMECGYARPTDEQLKRLDSSLTELIRAKSVLRQTATALGWPVPGAKSGTRRTKCEAASNETD